MVILWMGKQNPLHCGVYYFKYLHLILFKNMKLEIQNIRYERVTIMFRIIIIIMYNIIYIAWKAMRRTDRKGIWGVVCR